jgi:hypothetical protein
MIIQYEHGFPIEQNQQNLATPNSIPNDFEAKVAQYIMTWRQQCRSVFIQRRNIWDDCWKLYRGLDDFNMKQDWQSKIVLPKSFTTVKMATNTIKRLLSAAKKPWDIEAENPDDLIATLRAEQMTDLTKHFMDKAYFLKEFSEGLECAFILGLGVWKMWWGLVPRRQMRVDTQTVPIPFQMPQELQGQSATLLGSEPAPQQAPPPFGQPRFGYREQNVSQFPTQLAGEYINPQGLPGLGGAPSAPPSYLQVPQKKIVHEEILEGRLFIRAVDPYNFYWLPGSKLNRWVGTIEDVEIPKWELIKMAEAGLFPIEKVKQVQPRRIDERYKMSNLRFTETVMTQNGPNADTAVCKLTEYFGPLVWDGQIIEEYAHVILANDTTVLVLQRNPFIHRKPPYVAFSPLNLPFRTEGVGLIEMVRFIDKALSNLANLSVDTLVFRLLPLFEVAAEAFENPEDLETGIIPGKMLRKNLGHAGIEGIRPVQFEDISGGTTQVWSALDRAHQEGGLISDIAEGLPRWKGQQTATESSLLQQQSESFMGGMAADIEKEALDPLVTMSMDLIFQFLDTANDPRVASILGIGADVLRGMSKEDVYEMIAGDYKVKVNGITGQLMKSEMLQNLVQFMNLIGQNPQAWLPYINEDALLRRMLECFRPHIHDIEDIISDPATADAKKAAMIQAENIPHALNFLQGMMSNQQQPEAAPQLDPNNVLQHAVDMHTQQQDIGLQLQQQQHDKEMAAHDQRLQQQQIQAQQQQAEQEHQQQMQQMLLQAKVANAQANVRNSQKRK